MGSQGKVLEAVIDSQGACTPLSPWGGCVPFETESFEGRIFLAHKPPPGSGVPFEHSELLRGRAPKGGDEPIWELQIQGRLKAKPVGTVFFGFELWDAPMKLGLVTRALCRVILKFGVSLAKQRGVEIRHSFGDDKGDRPLLAFPLVGADRIFCSDAPVDLPIKGDDRRGVWDMDASGNWAEIERKSLNLVPGRYHTFLFATGRVDWTQWTVPGIPGLGSLDLTQFWGNQAAHMVVFDDGGGQQQRSRRLYFELRFQLVVPDSRQAAGAEPLVDKLEVSGGTEPVRQQVVVETEIIAETEETEEAENEEAPPVPGSDEGSSANGPPPDVGDWVKILATKRGGRLLVDDGSDLPYKVQFSDGDLPLADWYVRGAVMADPESDPGPQPLPSDLDDDLDAGPDLGFGRQLSAAAAATASAAATFQEADAAILEAIEERLDDIPVAAKGSFMVNLGVDSSFMAGAPPTIPWYFRSSGGSLWWCIEVGGRLCWRPSAHLQHLCQSISADDVATLRDVASFDRLESARRVATQVLAEGMGAPGLLEEFLGTELELPSLLGTTRPPEPWESVGVVEAEGCIMEHPAVIEEGRLVWYCRDSDRLVAVELGGASVEQRVVAGSPALLLTMPNVSGQRQFVLVFSSEDSAERWAVSLAEVCAMQSVSNGRPVAGAVPPLRWPDSRQVMNNTRLCLTGTVASPANPSALALSAALLRQALAAQRGGAADVDALAANTSALKCADLSKLNPQEVWCFWVNLYHCLLIHGRLACGMPNSIIAVVRFFNNTCYVVAGHAFSLTEMEHSILRGKMTKPHIRLRGLLLKAWQRTGQDLELRPCLAAPACAAEAFMPRPDWRLNLVLSAGNMSSSDTVPVLESSSMEALDATLQAVISRAIACAGRMDGGAMELPYNLYRYRSDAPGDEAERSEKRWARAILAPPGSPDSSTPGATRPDQLSAPDPAIARGSSFGGRISMMSFGGSAGQTKYSNKYDWKMRPFLSPL